MEKSFTVHLASNVSPEIFPQNHPSKFSTLLANELDLSHGRWEVAVQQIMYPTRVSATSEEDTISVYKSEYGYNDLLPHPESKINNDLTKFGLELKFQNYPSLDSQTFQPQIDYILKTVNENKWIKEKKLLKLEYENKKQKFVLHILRDDIIIELSKELAKVLCYYETAFHRKETYWANERFRNKYFADYDKLVLKVYDKTVMYSRKFILPLYSTGAPQDYLRNFKLPVARELISTAPAGSSINGDWLFIFFPNRGSMSVISYLKGGEEYVKYEKKVKFFHFEEAETTYLKMKKLYHHDGSYRFIVNTPITHEKGDIKSLNLTVYYDIAKDYIRGLEKEPILSFPIKPKTEIRTTYDLVDALNVNDANYGYKFYYDEEKRRIVARTGPNYGIELSKSLTSILGFEPLNDKLLLRNNGFIVAKEFPIVHRNISALYVYSNIIDNIYVGDVLAPLLLTCPYKGKYENDIMYQLEFLNPTFVPLNRSKVLQIDISIHDDAGALIPFIYGKTILSLLFRQMT